MGNGDRRKSNKMRQRKSQSALKARIKNKKAAPTASAAAATPKKKAPAKKKAAS